MECGKALAAAEMFITKLPDQVVGIADDALQGSVGYWRAAQEEAFQTPDVTRDEARREYDLWAAKSTAWKYVMQLEPLWGNGQRFHSDFHRALRRRK